MKRPRPSTHDPEHDPRHRNERVFLAHTTQPSIYRTNYMLAWFADYTVSHPAGIVQCQMMYGDMGKAIERERAAGYETRVIHVSAYLDGCHDACPSLARLRQQAPLPRRCMVIGCPLTARYAPRGQLPTVCNNHATTGHILVPPGATNPYERSGRWWYYDAAFVECGPYESEEQALTNLEWSVKNS